ncbi:MAG: response regulator [Chitinispirillales bacterium]|nr:response regulator [Chitinispirillales bacterium]
MSATFYAFLAAFFASAALVMGVMLWKSVRLGKKLLEDSSKLATVFSAIPDLVYCMDKDQRYTSTNKAFEIFVGKDRDDIIGKANDYVFAEKQGMAAYFNEINTKVLKEQKTLAVQEWATSNEGVKMFLDVIKMPLYQGGALTGMVGIARDITAHKAAETRALEASKVKSQFIANVSHEIRTPLNAIIGMSELLSLESLQSRQRNYVKDISIASHSLLSIINDILDFSKIEAGRLELNPIDYDFQEMMANLVSMFRFMARKKNLDFDYEEGVDGLPRCLYGDDVRLRQVLINLCANAVNFTNSGRVSLKITADDGKLTFEIADTGVGIKPDDLKNIFALFTRVDSVKNRDMTGTGLGLSICKTFVEMMGGTINVESEYGVGTALTVAIPMTVGDESKIVRPNVESGNVSFSAPDAKVLVVDDNNLNLKVAYRLLGLYGIAADMASSGEEAIIAVQRTSYDLVFMDHMMPDMNGIQATAKIRALGGKYFKLPIVALTANATRGVQEIFLSSGLNDYMPKPIELDTLSEILKRWIPIEKIGGALKDALGRIGEPVSAGASGFWEELANVGGINVEVGKNRVAGMEDMYRETLEIFYGKTPRECKALSEYLDAGDMQNFAILAHGMKSSLLTIGAMGLAETALELEKAGKAGNKGRCAEITPAFVEHLRDLHVKLSPICSTGNAQKTLTLPKGDGALFKEKLNAAMEYAEAYDGDNGVKAVEALMGYDYGEEANGRLKDVRTAFKCYDFEEVKKLLGLMC